MISGPLGNVDGCSWWHKATGYRASFIDCCENIGFSSCLIGNVQKSPVSVMSFDLQRHLLGEVVRSETQVRSQMSEWIAPKSTYSFEAIHSEQAGKFGGLLRGML